MTIAARSFTNTDFVRPMGLEVVTEAPLIANVSTEMKKDFTVGRGESVSKSIPGYGTVGTTARIDDANLGYADDKVSLTVSLKNVGVAMNEVERAVDCDDVENRISRPYGNNLRSKIQTALAETIMLSTPSVAVIGSGTATYADISGAITRVRKGRHMGELHGFMGNTLANDVCNSVATLFNPNQQLSKVFTNGTLGMYRGAEWHETTDIEDFTAGTHALGAGTTMKVKTIVNTNGATSVTLYVAGGTATLAGTITKGEAIQLTGKYVCDALGNTTGEIFNLIAAADATADSNELVVTCQPLYFTGAKKNITGESLAANTVATFAHTASKAYARGFVIAKPAVEFVSVKMRPIIGCEAQAVETPTNMFILGQWGGIVQDFINIMRFDHLGGQVVCRDMWTSRVDRLIG